jgi:hypothetical protein
VNLQRRVEATLAGRVGPFLLPAGDEHGGYVVKQRSDGSAVVRRRYESQVDVSRIKRRLLGICAEALGQAGFGVRSGQDSHGPHLRVRAKS